MKVLGFIGMLGIIFWAMSLAAGLGAFIDTASVVFVFGGAVFFSIAKGGFDQTIECALEYFGDGAVYFGWLAFIVGAIAILQNHDFQNVGPVVAINILPVFYGYLIRWVLVPFCVSFLKRKIKNDEINS